jgi:phospholipid/cholesterol/gamma-HCH transport system substrate-binding protein
MKAGLEAKVGIFVILCFVLIAFMSLKVGSFSFGKPKGMTIIAELQNAAGLTADSVVMFSGVEVGKVTEVKLIKGKPVITMVIDRQFEIPANIRIAVRASGFLGEKFAEIQVADGSAQGVLSDNSVITDSASSTDFDELGNKLADIADDVKQITSALREVLATEEGKDNMKATIDNVRHTTDMLRDIIAQNELRVHAIMKNVESLTASLNSVTVHNQQSVNEIVANLRSITKNIDQIVGTNKDDIEGTLTDLRSSVAKMDSALDNMDNITAQIRSGEGTVGKLIYDNSTLDNVNSTLTGLKSSLSKLDDLEVYLSFEGQRMFREDHNKGYFKLKIVPNEKRYYVLGVETHPDGRETKRTVKRDIISGGNPVGGDGPYVPVEYTDTITEDELTFTAMYAHRFHENVYFRIGVMESDFGFGFDYFPFKTRSFELNLDVYDFPDKDEDRDANVKAYAKYRFMDNFFVTGGVDNIINSDTRSFFLGGGVEFRDDDLKYLLGKLPKF